MATGDLKKQLALAVRSIQWSYAIFWSISARQPGVLEWGDGYYNGDIKTRKTIHSMELNADPLGLQRSEQLRELFESLSASEASPQAKRPSAALSPEDLTDTEWYYLVCMSFVFNIGQGLPGRTLATGRPIWLCDAHYADSKVFSRSLLAKSASIQTVMCFPFSGGVIELGVTELVLEDLSLIQHIKASFLEDPFPVTGKKCSTRSDPELVGPAFNHEIHDTNLIPHTDCEEVEISSPKNSWNYKEAEDSFMLEERNGGASQERSRQIMDDDFSNCLLYSVNSSDCISQTIRDSIQDVLAPDDKKMNIHSRQDVQDCNRTTQTALDGDDMHYQSVLSLLLKTSHPSILGPHSQNSLKESSFVAWKKVVSVYSHKSKGGTPQKLLKNILFQVPRMHTNGLSKSPENKSDRVGAWRPEAEDIATRHVVLERKRREKINEKLTILQSLVPSISKVDRVSILDDTIEYVQELERRLEELESCKQIRDSDARTKRKSNDTVERTSDNYGGAKNANGRRQYQNKRKACDIDEIMPEDSLSVSRDGSACSVSVNTNDKDVQIKIKCQWRDGILIEIMDAISHLHLDSHSVQSTTINGILSLTIKSKLKGVTAASAGAIKQALHRVAGKC